MRRYTKFAKIKTISVIIKPKNYRNIIHIL